MRNCNKLDLSKVLPIINGRNPNKTSKGRDKYIRENSGITDAERKRMIRDAKKMHHEKRLQED